MSKQVLLSIVVGTVFLSTVGSVQARGAAPQGGPTAKVADQQQPGPRIEFEEVHLDLGTLYYREKASDAYVFHNTGTETLEIFKVRSTCGCTPALPAKTNIAPGERGEIEVEFLAGYMRGQVVKHIYVDTNDPIHPRVDLTLSAQVKVELEFVPHGIYIGRLGTGEAIERTVSFYSPEVPAFSILEVTADHPAIHLGEPVRVGTQENRYTLAVTFGPVEDAARVNTSFVVRTDLPHSKEVVVRVYGRVLDQAILQKSAHKG